MKAVESKSFMFLPCLQQCGMEVFFSVNLSFRNHNLLTHGQLVSNLFAIRDTLNEGVTFDALLKCFFVNVLDIRCAKFSREEFLHLSGILLLLLCQWDLSDLLVDESIVEFTDIIFSHASTFEFTLLSQLLIHVCFSPRLVNPVEDKGYDDQNPEESECEPCFKTCDLTVHEAVVKPHISKN